MTKRPCLQIQVVPSPNADDKQFLQDTLNCLADCLHARLLNKGAGPVNVQLQGLQVQGFKATGSMTQTLAAWNQDESSLILSKTFS